MNKLGRWMTVACGATILFGFGNLYRPTVVVGDSMAPTFKTGRIIWVDQTYYHQHAPQRGEVVVFRLDGETYVKRVYRGPGETLSLAVNGYDVIAPVRDTRVDQLKDLYRNRHSVMRVQTLRVPDDCVYVLGDNFAVSEDSRQLGPIPIRSIIGRVHAPVDATVALDYEIRPFSIKARHRSAAPAANQAAVEQVRHSML
jgi:signal peptidase I